MSEGPRAIRARLHPAAILGVWAWQAALAALVSWPATSLARAAYGTDPRGDAPLFGAGLHELLDLLWRDAHGVTAVARQAVLILVAGWVAGVIPMAALMTAMAHPSTGLRAGRFAELVRAALAAFPTLGLMHVAVGLSQALVLGAGLFMGELVEGWTHTGLGEARSQQLGLAMGLPFLAAATWIGIAQDLARAAVVWKRTKLLPALVAGAGTLRRAPATLGWAWAWRAMAALALPAAAMATPSSLGARGPGLLVLALIHQGVVLARVALRASWLARALRSVSQAGDSER